MGLVSAETDALPVNVVIVVADMGRRPRGATDKQTVFIEENLCHAA